MKSNFYYIVLILVCISFTEIHAQGGMPGGRRKVTQTTKSDAESATKKRKHSSIINDSTKNIYGPKTTLSTTEKEIFENKRNSYQPLDTLIRDLHRWDFVQRNEYKYQDLGNLGTALNSIFPKVPSVIGATPGYKVYDLYYESAEPRWYDTKSPFSRINIIWGGRGRAITRVEFSRNVHKRFNFGFNYRPILSANQLDYAGNRNYQVTSQYYDAYTSYTSKNERYKILVSYRRMKHHVRENGGLNFFSIGNLYPKTDSLGGYKAFFNPNFAAHFTVSQTSVTAYSEDYRNAFHLFHHYQLAKPAQLYHILDLSSQVNTFRTTVGSETASFFPTSFADTTAVNDVNTFKVMQNEVGIKGNAAFLFYDFYYKLRMYSNNMNNLQAQAPHAVGKESYVGARIGFRFDSLSFLSGQAEYLLDGHYKIDGTLRTPWLDADLKSALSKPGFMQQVYRGGFNVWTNNYNSVLSNQLSGHLKLKWGPLFFSPGMTYTAYHNYIYFTHNDKIPMVAFSQQSSGNQQIVSPEVKMEVVLFKHLFIRPYLIVNKVVFNDDKAISMPQWFANAQLCYEGFVFKKALQMQVGFDAHANAAYNAMGYDPAIQQYFIQNAFTSPSFWNTDFFLNGRIKRGRFFAKYTNLIQIFAKQGYMPTPGYPNVPNVFDFGFELILFD